MKTSLQTKAALLGLSVAALISNSAMAIDVSAAATQFQDDFTGAAGVIGAAMIAAGFVAIVWNWAKGMLFS